MNMKTLGLIVAIVGVLGGAVGYFLFHISASHPNRLIAAFVLAGIFLIGGIVMIALPSKSGASA
jgi:zinc transporter ZupT